MAGPLDLRGRVTIIDAGATATLRGVGGAMAAVSRQAKAATGYVGNLGTSAHRAGKRFVSPIGGMSGTGMVGLGAAAGGLGFLNNEMAYQDAMNRTQAILNITNEEAFKPHRDLVVDLAKKYPATSAEIAKGASELAMAGMTLSQVNEVLEATVQGSMASGESIKTVGMGVTDVMMGLGKALTRENFAQINNVLAAASTSYAQDYTQFLGGFAKTAPIARMVGLDVNRLAGYLGILADAGFKAEKGGTALRTSLINLAAPTPGAANWLKQYGIDLAKFSEQVDTFQLGGEQGAQTLSDMLANTLGIDDESLDLTSRLKPLLSDPKAFKDIGKLKKKLTQSITSAMGLTDPVSTEKVADAVQKFIQAGFQQVNVHALLTELMKTGFDSNIAAMDDLFGKRFVAPMGAIIQSIRDGTFNYKFDELFVPRIAGAVERFAGILMQGLPGAIKRLGGAFDGLLRTMASSGAMDTIVGAIDALRDGINWLSSVNPGVLKGLTLALMGMAVLAPVGLAISAIGGGLATLAAGFALVGGLVGKIAMLSAALFRLGAAGRAAGKVAWLFGAGGAAAAGAAATGGVGAAGAAAAGGAGALALAKTVGRGALRFIPGLGLVLLAGGAAYGAYQAWSSGGGAGDVATGAVKGAVGLDGTVAPQQQGAAPAAPGASSAIAEIESVRAQASQGAASMRSAMAELSAAISESSASVAAAARSAAANIRSAAAAAGRAGRASLNTGPAMGAMPISP